MIRPPPRSPLFPYPTLSRSQARTPAFDRLWSSCPHALMRTSGADVGLPPGQMGNSEVGHLNIGAGRVVKQTLRSEEHTSELQSQSNLVCRLLLEKKKETTRA